MAGYSVINELMKVADLKKLKKLEYVLDDNIIKQQLSNLDRIVFEVNGFII